MKSNQKSKGDMSREETGSMGGETTFESHDMEYYQDIGRKGGKSQGQENNPGNYANRPKEDVKESGKKGGQK